MIFFPIYLEKLIGFINFNDKLEEKLQKQEHCISIRDIRLEHEICQISDVYAEILLEERKAASPACQFPIGQLITADIITGHLPLTYEQRISLLRCRYNHFKRLSELETKNRGVKQLYIKEAQNTAKLLKEEEKGTFDLFIKKINSNTLFSDEEVSILIHQFTSFTLAINEHTVLEKDIITIADATGFNLTPGIPVSLYHEKTSQKAMFSEENIIRENSYKNVRERQKYKNNTNINDLD